MPRPPIGIGGGIGGGIPGPPIGIGGGIGGGIPRPPIGIGGGIGGGFPTPPPIGIGGGIGGFPTPPPIGIGGGIGGGFPNPPGIGGPGIGGPGIGGPPIYQWNCGRCGAVLGSGTSPPRTAYCGLCRTTNTIPTPGGGNLPGVNPGATLPPIVGNFDLPPVPEPTLPEANPSVNLPSAPVITDSKRSTILKWVGIGAGVLMFIGLIIVVIVIALMSNAPAKRQTNRPRRRRDY